MKKMSYKEWLERDILIKEEELNLLKEQLSIILDIEKGASKTSKTAVNK